MTQIKSLSTAKNQDKDSTALILVGSFAPFHSGHVDAMESAIRYAQDCSINPAFAVYTPNRDRYVVEIKLSKENKNYWSFDNRLEIIKNNSLEVNIPVFVDDISGRSSSIRQINDEVAYTMFERFRISRSNLIYVCGSDQIESMQSVLNKQSKCICVLRPGQQPIENKCRNNTWLQKAIVNGRCHITQRKHTSEDISSTRIRNEIRLVGVLVK